MARFDVCKLNNSNEILIVKVQADILNELKTCVVIPLIPLKKMAKEDMPRLKPVISFKNKDYLLNTTDLTVVRILQIGDVIGSLEDQRHIVIDAMDFLFQGF